MLDADTGESVAGKAVLEVAPVGTPDQHFTSGYKGAVAIPRCPMANTDSPSPSSVTTIYETTFRVAAGKQNIGRISSGRRADRNGRQGAKALRTREKGDTVSYSRRLRHQ